MNRPSISKAQIDDLRERNPLVDVVADFGVKLKRNGCGPCPICGGDAKSSQRFEVKKHGVWVWAVCQDGGDVIRLVERVRGVGFREAVEFLGGAREMDAKEIAERDRARERTRAAAEAQLAGSRERERARLWQTWRQSVPFLGTPIETYLRGRDVEYLDDLCLRFLPDAPYFHGETVDDTGRRSPIILHRGPAMLAAFVDGPGRFIGLHFTWVDPARVGEKAVILDPDNPGERLIAKKMRGRKQGGYLKLHRGGDLARVRVGEGIETTLSVRDALRDGGFYVAAGDLGNLAGGSAVSVQHPTAKHKSGRALFVGGPEPDVHSAATPIPTECVELWFLKDGDSDPFTTDLAMLRAVKRNVQEGRKIRVIAPTAGADFNDMLRGTDK